MRLKELDYLYNKEGRSDWEDRRIEELEEAIRRDREDEMEDLYDKIRRGKKLTDEELKRLE